MRVVLFKVNHLGDSLVFLPVVQALRRRCPDWRLTVITAEAERPVYAGDLPPERIWTAPGRTVFNHSWRRPWRYAAWWSRLRDERPDACLLSYDQGNAAHLLAWQSGAPVRIGAHLPWLHFRRALTHAVDRPPSARIADWNWAMAAALVRLGGRDGWPDTPPPPDLRHLGGGVPREPRLVVIHAGARAAIRRWGAERMAAVARLLVADGCRVAWVDRPDSRLPAPIPGVEPVAPGTLAELAGLLARASLMLCNNSGPMHLANALGTPLLVISGPSSRDWDPYWHRERNRVLRMPGLDCIGCEDSAAGTETCANVARPLACMEYWTPELVAAECRARLAAGTVGAAP